MTRLFVWLCAACFCLAAPAVFAQPLPDRAPLSGTITARDGGPIANAFVSLRRQNDDGAVAFWGATALGDGSGRFAFSDAEEGAYFLHAEAPGYAPLDNVAVNWKTGSAPLQLKLSRLVNLSLQLNAPTDAVIANAPVTLRLRAVDGSSSMQRSARSDAAGNVAVGNVTPGTYALYLRSGPFYALQTEIQIDELAAAAIPIDVHLGGTLELVLTDDAGQSLGGANLALTPATPDEARRLGSASTNVGEDFALLSSGNNRAALVTRDGDGTLEVGGLPPGRYQPRLYLPGTTFGALEPVEIVAGQTTPLVIKVPARNAPTLTLDLRTAGDAPYTAGEVTLRILPLAANGALGGEAAPPNNGAGGLPFFPAGPGGRRARPDQNGRITLYPTKAGNYRVFVAPVPKNPGEAAPQATPVDVTIAAQGATATVVVPG